jgi:hypothetical protein
MSYGTSPLQGTAPQQSGPKKVTFAQQFVFLRNMNKWNIKHLTAQKYGLNVIFLLTYCQNDKCFFCSGI